jgi:hypothetical protein
VLVLLAPIIARQARAAPAVSAAIRCAATAAAARRRRRVT